MRVKATDREGLRFTPTIINVKVDTAGDFWKPGNVIIRLCGPQGGHRATESISPDEARKLRDRLNLALAEED